MYGVGAETAMRYRLHVRELVLSLATNWVIKMKDMQRENKFFAIFARNLLPPTIKF